MSDLPDGSPARLPRGAAILMADLAGFGVRLPLRLSTEEAGCVVDDDGEDVITIDVYRDRPDAKATGIAALIVAAVNSAAGYLAVATGDPAEPIRWVPARLEGSPAQ